MKPSPKTATGSGLLHRRGGLLAAAAGSVRGGQRAARAEQVAAGLPTAKAAPEPDRRRGGLAEPSERPATGGRGRERPGHEAAVADRRELQQRVAGDRGRREAGPRESQQRQ